MKKRKSLCGRYTCVWLSYIFEAFVIDNKTGIIYDEAITETKGRFYARSHMMIGYSAYGEGMKNPNRYFTLSFADTKKGKRLKPYSGNTIINNYSAVFIKPKEYTK